MRHRIIWGEVALTVALVVFGTLHTFGIERFEFAYRVLLLAAVFYLFHLISPIRIMFGDRSIPFDITFVLGFILLAGSSAFPFLGPFAESTTLVVGALLLLTSCVLASERLPVVRPSVSALFAPRSRSLRILVTFLLMFAFFVMLFEPFVRMTLSLSDVAYMRPLLSLLTLLWVLEEQGIISLPSIRKAGEVFSMYVNEALSLFFRKRTFLLGVTGLLVLHYGVQIGIAIVPALIDAIMLLDDPLHIGAGVIGAFGTLALFLLPLYIWFTTLRLRKNHARTPNWPGIFTGVTLSCIVVALMYPLVQIRPTAHAGAEVIPEIAQGNPALALGAGALILLICLIVGRLDDYLRRVLMMGPFVAAVIYFGAYVYQAFVGSFLWAIALIVTYLTGSLIFSIPVIIALFAMQVLFFVAGYLSFLYEIWRE